MLVFYCISLLKFPRDSPEQSVWSKHMLLLLLEPPGQLSWENTEHGSGSLLPDLSLWTPAGPQGPSGLRHVIQKQQPRVWSWKEDLFPKAMTSTGGLFACVFDISLKRIENSAYLAELSQPNWDLFSVSIFSVSDAVSGWLLSPYFKRQWNLFFFCPPLPPSVHFIQSIL